MSEESRTIVCLAHLSWDHVWQRPQQLMTRFAQQQRVIYVDPPELRDDVELPELRELRVDQGVRVLHPCFPKHAAEHYRQMWQDLLPSVLQQAGSPIVLWVYSPYADYLVAQAKPDVALTVYDCMDDLASFKDGTPEMREREAYLLTMVDLVFTGGFSMYEARKNKHPHVYCFPSGVDIAHYQQVQAPETPIAAAAAAIPHPQLGYFGVLDERIDWGLIAEVAAERPEWQWVLVGPTAKVNPDELPKAANIHYLGQQRYTELPHFLKSFDVATMPFALNEATRFISPTKTLEYLAGGKPVISSSVPDVVAFYNSIVSIADGPEAWVAAIEALLSAAPEELQARRERAAPVLEANTWDAIAAKMMGSIDDQLGQKP